MTSYITHRLREWRDNTDDKSLRALLDEAAVVIDGRDRMIRSSGNPVAEIEAVANGKYWQMAKGKVRSGEPLYGAALIEPGTNKIFMIGEADDLSSAIRAMQPATEN